MFVLPREQTVEIYLSSLTNLLVNIFTAQTPAISIQTLTVPFSLAEL